MTERPVVHALTRYLAEQMASHGWTQTDLSQRSGLSKQTVSKLVNDQRDRLTGVPKPETVQALAKAFATSEAAVWIRVAESLGVPADALPVVVDEISEAPTERLLEELASRLGIAPGPPGAGGPTGVRTRDDVRLAARKGNVTGE